VNGVEGSKNYDSCTSLSSVTPRSTRDRSDILRFTDQDTSGAVRVGVKQHTTVDPSAQTLWNRRAQVVWLATNIVLESLIREIPVSTSDTRGLRTLGQD